MKNGSLISTVHNEVFLLKKIYELNYQETTTLLKYKWKKRFDEAF